MKTLLILILALCLGCAEEPDRIIGSTTEDGHFEITLEASREWVRPGDSLPIKVRIEQLVEALDEDLSTEVEFVVNNGSVSPSSLDVDFFAPYAVEADNGEADDGEAEDADDVSREAGARVFEQWITFEADSRADASVQGEIHALFLDIRSTLKIRITPPAE
ncbi:MAG: hypothetical protein ACKVJG_27120 [Candidatus Latescibacterota bacterium]|jgi:hypothetical protein